ncbi:MAG: hypothetical protein ACOC2U_00895 [bacterium]
MDGHSVKLQINDIKRKISSINNKEVNTIIIKQHDEKHIDTKVTINYVDGDVEEHNIGIDFASPIYINKELLLQRVKNNWECN